MLLGQPLKAGAARTGCPALCAVESCVSPRMGRLQIHRADNGNLIPGTAPARICLVEAVLW